LNAEVKYFNRKYIYHRLQNNPPKYRQGAKFLYVLPIPNEPKSPFPRVYKLSPQPGHRDRCVRNSSISLLLLMERESLAPLFSPVKITESCMAPTPIIGEEGAGSSS
jgi:hypothetical protein